MKKFWQKAGVALGAGVLAVGGASTAMAQVVLPDIGVDVPATVTALGTDLGTMIAAVFGIFAVVLIIRAAYSWIKRSVRG